MSTPAKTEGAEKHEAKEFLVTAFSKKPASRNAPSSDIIWSEVWDSESTIGVGYPFRWILQRNGENLWFRDLGTEGSGVVTHPVKEIPLSELSRTGLIDLTGNDPKRHCWVLIQPIQELREIERQAEAGGWVPKMIRPVSASEYPTQLFFRKTVISIAAGMLIMALLIFFLPRTPENKDKLIPEEFAKVLLTPALKTDGAAAAPKESGSPGGATNVVVAFQSAAVQKTTKSLLSAGAAKALLSGSTLLNTTTSSAQARRVLDSGSSLSKGITASSSLQTSHKAMGLIGGKGTGTGNGYGAGGGVAIEGQGKGLVSVGVDSIGVSSEGLTKNEVGKVIREHMADVRYCYDSALLRNPSLDSKMVLTFTVKGSGSVGKTKVKESSIDPELDQCILTRLAKWKFPKPRGGVDVEISYPFIFKVLAN